MVGCGTVAVEAAVSGRSGLFSDIDQLACLLARAKSRPVDPDWLIHSFETITRKARPIATPSRSRGKAKESIRNLEGSTRFRAPPHVFQWFQPYVVTNLCRALYQASEFTESSRRGDSVLSVFASIIRKISRADPSTSSGLEVTKIRRKELRNGLRFNVGQELKNKAKLLAKGYRDIRKAPSIGRARVILQDVRHWSELCSNLRTWPDLIITSPCYMSAIEYWRRHKLEYCWLGLVSPALLPDVRGDFLGMGNADLKVESLPLVIRKMYNRLSSMKRSRDAKGLANYFEDSRLWLQEIKRVLEKSHGTAYVVAGGNTNHGFDLNTPLALQAISKDVGLKASTLMRYRIKNSYMQYPTNGNRIRYETVLKIVVN